MIAFIFNLRKGLAIENLVVWSNIYWFDCFFIYLVNSLDIYWGERSESLPSLQRCNFVCLSVCMYVCMYVCMSWTTGRHNNLFLGLMILYQLLRELLRMGTTLATLGEDTVQTETTLHATGTQTLLRPQARLQQVRVAQMGTFWAWGHTGTPAGIY